MYEQRLSEVMDKRRLLRAPGTMTVSQAAKSMASRGVGAVLVMEDEKLVGIFTERDAVFRVIARGLDPAVTPLTAVMTSPLYTMEPDRRFGDALSLMYAKGFRHVPVIDQGKLVGMVSARNALDPDMEDFIAEAHRREQFLPSQS